MPYSKRKSRRRRRTPRVEKLEDRLVFSFVIDHLHHGQVTARDDGFTIAKDSEVQEFDVLQNDRYWSYTRNPDVDNLEISADATHGSTEVSEDGTKILYRPGTDFVGVDRFSYRILVGGETMEADVFVNVVEPLYALRDWFRVDENTSDNELDVLSNDLYNASAVAHRDGFTLFRDENSQLPLTIQSVSEGSAGGQAVISEDGRRLHYTPADGYEGLEEFTYVMQNDDGYTSEGTVEVQVTTLDSGQQVPVWPEQLEQRLLELSVQRNKWRFGSFQPEYHPDYYYEDVVTWRSDAMIGVPLNMFSISDADTFTLQAGATQAVTTELAYSNTNNQVEGVDEGDLVKTDGHYLYMVSNWTDEQNEQHHQLIIADVRDPDNPAVLSRYAFAGNAVSLHLNVDRVTVLSHSDGDTLVTALDVSKRHDPTLSFETSIHGQLQATRAIGDYVYVVADTSANVRFPVVETICTYDGEGCFYETAAQFVERIADTITDGYELEIETRDADGLVTTESINLATTVAIDEIDQLGLSTVISFDMAGDSGVAHATSWIRESTSDIYVSAESIYMTSTFWAEDARLRWSGNTRIEKLSLGAEGQIDWVASGSVAGQLLNSFSMDEHDGYLRIATTNSTSNSLHILEQAGDDLQVVGSVEDLAHGEQIYSARFDGDRAFVVTFRTVDPLFVFDLSDPADPQVLGELKVTGYSNYLHLIDENHLLGIGREANGSGLFQEIQVSLFDISDLENPRVVDRYGFEGGRELWSPLLQNPWNLGTHHSVSYFSSHQTLVLPVYEDAGNRRLWAQPGETADVSMRVLDIDLENGISALGQVDFEDEFDPHSARSVRVGDVLYSISPELIQAHELRSPENKISELEIGSGATDDLFSMRASETGELDVLANDLTTIAAASSREIVAIEQPTSGGQVEINPDDGTISFVPELTFQGIAKFSYVTETDGVREKANVRIDVRRAWHNAGNPMDVNHDDEVTPRDMLQLVNLLNSWGTGSLDALDSSAQMSDLTESSTRFVDTNNDGRVTPRDLLFLVNHFMRQSEQQQQPTQTSLSTASEGAEGEAIFEGEIALAEDSRLAEAWCSTPESTGPGVVVQELIEPADKDEWDSAAVDEVFATLESTL